MGGFGITGNGRDLGSSGTKKRFWLWIRQKARYFLPGFDGTESDLEGVDRLEFEDEFLRRKIF